MYEIDFQGRPWPDNFLRALPLVVRERLSNIHSEIDEAASDGDIDRLIPLLEAWRLLLNLNA